MDIGTVGYLGPSGTFTEAALLTQPDLAAAEHVLYRSHSDVLHSIGIGEIDFGFCAIENAIEGTVNVVQDTLAFEGDLMIQREVVIPITMNLLIKPGSSLAAGHAAYLRRARLGIPYTALTFHGTLRPQQIVTAANK